MLDAVIDVHILSRTMNNTTNLYGDESDIGHLIMKLHRY